MNIATKKIISYFTSGVTLLCLAFSASAQNSPATRSTEGQWVWANTGWNVHNTPFSDTGRATTTVVSSRSSVTGTVDAQAVTSRMKPYSNSSAELVFALTNRFYWKSACRTPCPAPPTQKQGQIDLKIDGDTKTSPLKTVAEMENPSILYEADAHVNTSYQFAYSDDFSNTYDPSYATVNDTFRFASNTEFGKYPDEVGGTFSTNRVFTSKLKCSVSFFCHYSIEQWLGHFLKRG